MRRLAIAVFTFLSMLAGTTHANEVYPLEYWAAQTAVSNVRLSPDGSKLAMLVTPGLGVDPVIQIYNTNSLAEGPRRYNAASLKIENFTWISNDTIVVTFSGQVRERIRGFNQGTFRYTAATLDVEEGKFDRIGDNEGRIASSLPTEANKVILSVPDRRVTDYYLADIDRGTERLILKGNEDVFSINFDDLGNPRTANSVTLGGGPAIFQTLYRKPGERSWTVIHELSEESFEQFDVVGFYDDPRYVYVLAHNGADKVSLWKFDTEQKQFMDRVYSRTDGDVIGIRVHSNRAANPDELVAASYLTADGRRDFEFFDTESAASEGALLDQLEAVIPNAYYLRIISRSSDGNTLLAYNIGPKDTGSYYLVKNGQLQYISSGNPFVKSNNLSELEYVKYPSRHGDLTVPAWVTIPSVGKAPYPTIVLPHGGPFVQEVIDYDKWSQMLANQGYLVIQPQYRGSRGYGLSHYTAAFLPRGEGGGKMQDDKDDGALYLASQGLSDPNRLAMFGWSYGGYAAVTAASRPADQIYQCAIAGASVPDTRQQVNYYRDRLRGSSRVEQLRFWDDSYNPIENPSGVNIPLLLIHGTSDQRTPLRGVRDYMKALDQAGSTYKYVELPKADHFFGTIGYDNELKAYSAMLDFLANDCGIPTEQNPAN
ncbi:alpha/beta hydrolase family protein [Parvularcula marina]|uniref:alpha/beta hydrolase family protein n=1 Tax=Parvularcula marina TaxID=2292771 RepID=UPI0035153CE2